MPGCSWRGHLRGVHIHYCPGVLGGDTCEGYIFITARVFLEGTPAMGTYGFHYCPGVLGGDTCDGYIWFSLLPGCSWRGHLRWVEDLKASTQHPAFETTIVNISKEDVEPPSNSPIQEIINPDDQPMWESAKTVAPTPNSAITRPDVDNNFVINSTHLNMTRENKFDGYLRADPHDHIRKFLVICDMFKYGETQSKVVNLLIFPFSLCDEAKSWFNELNEESITSWDQLIRDFINRFFPPSLFKRRLLKIRNFSQLVCESLTDAWLRLKNMLPKCHGHGLTKETIIQIFYHGLDEPTQGILDITAGGIFLYKSPNQAYQFLEDKVLFKLDWSTKSQNDHHQESVAFPDGSNSNFDNSLLMEKLKARESQIITLKEELQDMHNKYNELKDENASKKPHER
ncbi:reverse transcriptase domain-containing protein [Tanacetum coccineum]